MEMTERQRRRLERLAAMPDDQIDTSDIPEIIDWSDGVRGGLAAIPPHVPAIHIDADILIWFGNNGKDGRAIQSEINRVLREHVAGRAKPPTTA